MNVAKWCEVISQTCHYDQGVANSKSICFFANEFASESNLPAHKSHGCSSTRFISDDDRHWLAEHLVWGHWFT